MKPRTIGAPRETWDKTRANKRRGEARRRQYMRAFVRLRQLSGLRLEDYANALEQEAALRACLRKHRRAFTEDQAKLLDRGLTGCAFTREQIDAAIEVLRAEGRVP